MSDPARHVIPGRLDDPERWLFWTVDEAAVLMDLPPTLDHLQRENRG